VPGTTAASAQRPSVVLGGAAKSTRQRHVEPRLFPFSLGPLGFPAWVSRSSRFCVAPHPPKVKNTGPLSLAFLLWRGGSYFFLVASNRTASPLSRRSGTLDAGTGSQSPTTHDWRRVKNGIHGKLPQPADGQFFIKPKAPVSTTACQIPTTTIFS
jgi:hypothetical protein